MKKLFNLFRNKEKELQEAKQKVISDLETKGIKLLLSALKSDEVYSEIILERQKKGSFNGDDNISWLAFLQTTKLHTSADKEELLSLLDNKEYEDQRRDILCCLSSVCSNSNDRELFFFLLKIIEKEEEESTVVSVLSRLDDFKKDKDLNIEFIKNLVVHGTSDIRRAAIKALQNSEDPAVEDLLLSEFKCSDKITQIEICATLNTVGTIKSLPVMKAEYKKTKDRALRMLIEITIERIEEKRQ